MAVRGNGCNERGSALMLVPAGFLVLIVLAAIAVDSAVAFMAQRELTNLAAGAANDATTVSLTDAELQKGAGARPDEATAARVVEQRLSGVRVAGYTLKAGDIATSVQDDVVTVSLRADVDYVFAKAIPGARHQSHPQATASAQLQFR